MRFFEPDPEELTYLRADPLVHEQELDCRPEAAEALEKAAGRRAGRVYWRSEHDHLYALELGDLGRGRPSTATVFGHWDRFEPRPPEHEIDLDLMAFNLWMAEAVEGMNPEDIAKVAGRSGIPTTWPEGSVRRTPEERFARLQDFAYEPHYVEIEGLRMAYVEAGSGDPLLMLHGEPTWGYLYRRMIPRLAEAGRVIVPDLIGFGRSDKPKAPNAYSNRSHVRWVRKFIEALDLERITLVCQDWGGSLGLQVLSQRPERFSRLVAMHTGLSGGGGPRGEAFLKWRRFTQRTREIDCARLIKRTLVRRKENITREELAAYQAPFPSAEYQTAALVFPRLVPIRQDHPGAYDQRQAIKHLGELDLPVFLPWGDSDPITGAWKEQLQGLFSNVQGAPVIEGAGHFIQEDAGEEVAELVAEWMGLKR